MRKVLKWVLRLLLVVLALAGAAALFVQLAGIPKYPVERVELKVEVTPQRVARGRQFAQLLCVSCHYDPATRALTGKHMDDAPPVFGSIYSRNITQSQTHGIGAWTDGELAFLLRTGLRKDGQYLPPYMVKLAHLSDEDLYSVIAFLRSDDPLVKSSEADPPRTRPGFLTKLLSRLAWKPLPYPRAPIAAPNRDDRVAYGRYLVEGLECYACHSADLKTVDIAEPDKTPGYLGGGSALLDLGGKKVFTTNLTPDETGIGKWSEGDFTRTLRTGLRPDHSVVRYPMEPMPTLSEADAGAIFAYLQTVPKINNPRKTNEGYELAANESDGKKLYYKYACYSCHGERGVGTADLRQNRKTWPTDDGLKAWLKNAPALKPDTRMPAWDGVIAENEYDPLIRYVRELSTD
jgi:mono/diheme cytochrome c family protein